jgi:hypothetical protein
MPLGSRVIFYTGTQTHTWHLDGLQKVRTYYYPEGGYLKEISVSDLDILSSFDCHIPHTH